MISIPVLRMDLLQTVSMGNFRSETGPLSIDDKNLVFKFKARNSVDGVRFECKTLHFRAKSSSERQLCPRRRGLK